MIALINGMRFIITNKPKAPDAGSLKNYKINKRKQKKRVNHKF
jgi:hypothetical protein